jgi:hypothetical protein
VSPGLGGKSKVVSLRSSFGSDRNEENDQPEARFASTDALFLPPRCPSLPLMDLAVSGVDGASVWKAPRRKLPVKLIPDAVDKLRRRFGLREDAVAADLLRLILKELGESLIFNHMHEM